METDYEEQLNKLIFHIINHQSEFRKTEGWQILKDQQLQQEYISENQLEGEITPFLLS